MKLEPNVAAPNVMVGRYVIGKCAAETPEGMYLRLEVDSDGYVTMADLVWATMGLFPIAPIGVGLGEPMSSLQFLI